MTDRLGAVVDAAGLRRGLIAFARAWDTPDPRTAGNHNAMKDADVPERDLRALVGAIGVPVLVVHGTADPMFPKEHGIALAEAVPGAGLLLLEGVGHQAPPRSTWDRVLAALPYSPKTRRV